MKYGTLLVSQGSLKTALKYISDSTDANVMDLKERINIVLGSTRPVVRQARSRQTSESSRHYSLSKRPSYPGQTTSLQHSPVAPSGFDPGSLTGPVVPPHPQETAGPGGYYNPLNVNTAFTAPPSLYGHHTPIGSGLPSGGSSYFPTQTQDQRRPSASLPPPPVSSVPHGWNDPPPLKAKPKVAQSFYSSN